MAGLLGQTYLVGTWKFWVADAGEAEPDLDDGSLITWTELGLTRDDQAFQWTGTLTGLTDNDTTGMRRHIRPEEGFTITANLAQLTLENIAQITGLGAAAVTTGTSGVLSVKELNLLRGFEPKQFAILARGAAVGLTPVTNKSPYLAGPAQIWIPCGVFDGEPELTFNKEESPSMEFIYTAEIDDTQPTGEEFGRWIAQES